MRRTLAMLFIVVENQPYSLPRIYNGLKLINKLKLNNKEKS